MRPVFMRGEWRDIVVLNWFVEPARVQSLVPAGVELDIWDGLALVSLVGLKFLRLRAVGIPAPGLQAFAQVNVRVCVKRQAGDEVRHGVRFLAQMAPSRIMAAGAQLTMHEPFLARDTRVDDVRMPLGRRSLTYTWRDGPWHHVSALVDPPPRQEREGSLENFVLQRCWGYTPQPDGGTLEYQVEHPLWRIWSVLDVERVAGWGDVLPASIASVLARPPAFAVFAEGSEVQVHTPRRLS